MADKNEALFPAGAKISGLVELLVFWEFIMPP